MSSLSHSHPPAAAPLRARLILAEGVHWLESVPMPGALEERAVRRSCSDLV